MFRRVSLAALVLSLVAGLCALIPTNAGALTSASPSPWLMGYYPVYERALMPINQIEWDSLTHLVVGRVEPLEDGTVQTTFDWDVERGPAYAKQLVASAHAHGVKALLMVGGAGTYAGFTGAMRNRAKFVTNLLDTVSSLGFDGVDLDWEPIATSSDQTQLLSLVTSLRNSNPKLLITVPVRWWNSNLADVSTFYGDLAAQVDHLDVMTYNMSAAARGWSSWHYSALDGAGVLTPSSVTSTVRAYLRAGVPAAKLGIGIGFFGTCWTGKVTGPNQVIAGSSIVDAGRDVNYRKILGVYFNQMTPHRDDAAGVPYLSAPSPVGPQGCTYISYEDAQSAMAKGNYAKSQALGGAIVWTIPQIHDANAPAGKRDTVLRSIRSAVGA